jgi:hypothetical protein
MSTFAYAALTASRENAAADHGAEAPSVKTYVDAVAALVPAEVLALHALAISLTTEKLGGSAGATITKPGSETLTWLFFVLVALSAAIYIAKFKTTKETSSRLWLWRAAIPPLAFVCWTALQQTSAFDAVFPNVAIAPRVIGAAIGAIVLGYAAQLGAAKAATAPSPPAVTGAGLIASQHED